MKTLTYRPSGVSSFFRGWGRILDPNSSLHLHDPFDYVASLVEMDFSDETAAKFIADDWGNVGGDIWKSMKIISSENSLNSPEEFQLLLPLDE